MSRTLAKRTSIQRGKESMLQQASDRATRQHNVSFAKGVMRQRTVRVLKHPQKTDSSWPCRKNCVLIVSTRGTEDLNATCSGKERSCVRNANRQHIIHCYIKTKQIGFQSKIGMLKKATMTVRIPPLSPSMESDYAMREWGTENGDLSLTVHRIYY